MKRTHYSRDITPEMRVQAAIARSDDIGRNG